MNEEPRRTYERELRMLKEEFSPAPARRLTLLATVLFPRHSLRSLARRIDRLARCLAAIDPPADVVDEHEELRAGFIELGRDMSALARDRSLSRWKRWRLLADSPAVQRLGVVADSLRAKGIDVPR